MKKCNDIAWKGVTYFDIKKKKPHVEHNQAEAYQAYLDEIRSDDRDKAAAFSEEFKYYYDWAFRWQHIPKIANGYVVWRAIMQ